MSNSFSIVISAPSGAGKTTLIKRLIAEDSTFQHSISTTTRAKREGEIEGESYYFVPKEEFMQMIYGEEFVEWARVYHNYYGTRKKEIDRIKHAGNIPIFDVDVQGSKELKNKIDDAVFIFIVPPSLEVLEKRLRDRETETEEQLALRLGNAKKELNEFEMYDYIIINDDLEHAVKQLQAIGAAELCKRERVSSYIHTIMGANGDSTT
ncbi:MAG: guanylate kinase [bacterium]|nr:guanylate kinase [bacterium]